MIDRILQLPENKSFFLFGPRQTGKSTLLKSRYSSDKTCIYYDLLHSETFRRLAARPELLRMEIQAQFGEKAVSHIIIDEIQKIPALLDEIQSVLESGLPLHFALSGSSARKLKRAHANMLGGRAWTLRLFPLTSLELANSFDLERALHFGTLPSVYLAEATINRSETLRSYVDTYIREEIELEAQLRNLGGFLRFLPIVASENGAQVNFLNVARELSLSAITARGYYKILEDTLLGFFLHPFAHSERKRTSRHPKFYLFDCGVVRALQKKLNAPLVEGSDEYGRAFEHFLICEIFRINEYLRLDLDISFYRTEKGAEVDCILRAPSGKILAIQIKSATAPARAHLSGLRSFNHDFPEARCILACRAPRALRLGEFTALPWQDVLDEVKHFE
jgi:predicted AAA+ superfamily ATPase